MYTRMLEVKLSDETIERVSEAVLTKAMGAAQVVHIRDAEINRLQRWLGFIAGGFSPPSESAERALKGEPPPDGF